MKANNLSARFKPQEYKLRVFPDSGVIAGHLIITGQKLPPPSKRITLHQDGLKITSAKIFRAQKNVTEEHEVIRINHLKTRGEVRLHCRSLLYPGQYRLELEFIAPKAKATDYQRLAVGGAEDQELRRLLPAIDDPYARAEAEFTVSW